ncbi:hypothetical protein SPRG_09672 [Saprolegnia parasitica CBS 223.65]|uniref:Golgi to ER traffic protein 4 n=1 Tax=Saprolegnia parasitica (strain CBS 223.65) TaxID=695850 RepID=A0A067C238_SAPPC|nr:hypothetical protein SPRG_09672 [Saprolegnia parasitica CBS 223.65]KDO24839.1 hypothetical protein SPRG_09672 [Saprolegnia parasitica CBS 223.65]|eukprot:XP_012204486.1 hypothetical protein SPRG_09672 [Saprolegnia parasitica CBS 223.65]
MVRQIKSARGAASVAEKLEERLKQGDFYGALQMYKTLYSRYAAAGDHMRAIDLAHTAAVQLAKHDQFTAAREMGCLMIDLYMAQKFTVDAANKARVQAISEAFSATATKDHSEFLKQAVKWSKRTLQLWLARVYTVATDYTSANNHFLHAEQPREMSHMLVAHAATGYASEADLFVARAVLQLICLENLRDANIVLTEFLAARPLDTPLINCVKFILRTLERDALPLFQLLQERYAYALSRDPSFRNFMSIIAQKYYGVQPPQSALSSLMSMFGGGM